MVISHTSNAQFSEQKWNSSRYFRTAQRLLDRKMKLTNMPQILKFMEMLNEFSFLPCHLDFSLDLFSPTGEASSILTSCNSSSVFAIFLYLSAPSISFARHPSCCTQGCPEHCIFCGEPGKLPSHFWSRMKHLNQSYSMKVKSIHLKTAVQILPLHRHKFNLQW